MLKKVLCMAVIMVMAVATLTVTGVSAANFDSAENFGKFYMGDADMDSRLSIKDATAIRKAIAGFCKFSDFQLRLSDVDENGVLNVKDATVIQKYLASLTDTDVFGKMLVNGTVETETPDDDEVAETTPIVTEPETPEETTVPEETVAPETVPSEKDDVAEESLSTLDEIEHAVEEKFLEYVNEERTSLGLVPLKMNTTLNKAADVRSHEITFCWSHNRPDGTDFYTAIDDIWSFGQVGENIACNGGILNFSEETLEENIDYAARFFFGQFKSSPGHYANMICENYTCTGIGVEIQGPWCYMAHMFGAVDA